MRLVTAQLPEPPNTDDRVFLTPNAVIVLDGASAFLPVPVSASTYVDHLGWELERGLLADPEADLRLILGDAIANTSSALALEPGRSPSSTVAIARALPRAIDVLVLGDTQIVTPTATVRDNRINRVATAERGRYVSRLEAGFGYDAEHRKSLCALQHAQALARNSAQGYWIAEADPLAARQALTREFSPEQTVWLVMATDGAYKLLEHLGLHDWLALAQANSERLRNVLHHLQRWEDESDPDGSELPRAKLHDDKTLTAVILESGRPFSATSQLQ